MIRLVIIESPYAGDIGQHLAYLRRCMRDCVERGESPYASHALLTQPGVLRDEDAEERALGIELGFAWRSLADVTAVYTDYGISRGMQAGIDHAVSIGGAWEHRTIGRNP